MVKSGSKRAPVAAEPPPVIVPKKIDPGLQSLMDYGDNLEEFISICAHLPADLKRDLNEVATLNESTHKLTAELSRDQTEILERAKSKYRSMTRPDQLESLVDEEALERAQVKRRKVDKSVSEKVAITKRMYDALDTCIKNIDEEIDKLEKDVKETYGVIPDFNLLAPEVAAEAKKKEMEAASAAAGVAGASQAGGGAAMMSTGVGGVNGTALKTLVSGAEGAARRDDAIVANEPVYCICRQVGWGDMIGCDNEDCEHGEWFHYHCVGLENVDQDLSYWLCPGCSADAREKERLEQLEMIRAAKAKQTTLKLPAVKLPQDGDTDGEDEAPDNDSVENEDTSTSRGNTKPADSGPISGSTGATTRGMSAAAEVENPLEKGAGGVETRESSSSLSQQHRQRSEGEPVWSGLGELGENYLPGKIGSGGHDG